MKKSTSKHDAEKTAPNYNIEEGQTIKNPIPLSKVTVEEPRTTQNSTPPHSVNSTTSQSDSKPGRVGNVLKSLYNEVSNYCRECRVSHSVCIRLEPKCQRCIHFNLKCDGPDEPPSSTTFHLPHNNLEPVIMAPPTPPHSSTRSVPEYIPGSVSYGSRYPYTTTPFGSQPTQRNSFIPSPTHSVPVSLWVNHDGTNSFRLFECNDAFVKFFGYPLSSLLSDDFDLETYAIPVDSQHSFLRCASGPQLVVIKPSPLDQNCLFLFQAS